MERCPGNRIYNHEDVGLDNITLEDSTLLELLFFRLLTFVSSIMYSLKDSHRNYFQVSLLIFEVVLVKWGMVIQSE